MRTIPLFPIPSQTLNIILGDQDCTLSLYWRQERLYLDLLHGTDVVCRGAVCENRTDIIQSPTRVFSGMLYFMDLQGDRPPHWQELGTRYVLVYAPENGE